MSIRGRSVSLKRRAGLITPIRLLFVVAALAAVGLVWYQGQRVVGWAPPTATVAPSPTAGDPVEEARARFSVGDFAGSADAYRRAIETDELNVDLWVGLARSQLYAEDYPGGLQSARTAVLVQAQSERAQAILAWALWYAGEYEEAGMSARRAIARNPTYAPAYAFLSLVLNSQRRYTEGLQQARRALELDPNLIESRFAMGYASEAQGDYLRAVEHYELAIQANPNLVFLYRRIGFNYRELERQVQAGEPDDPLADQYLQASIDAFSRAIAVAPTNVIPYLDLARTYAQTGRLGTAEQLLERALELEPDNPAIHGRLGLLWLARGERDRALTALELAVAGGRYAYVDPSGASLAVTVAGLALDGRSLDYYVVYGELLAAGGACGPDQAPRYLVPVRQIANSNEALAARAEAALAVCAETVAQTPDPTP
jgi:tetratricopeptide (TPR) repeat protein